MPSVIKINDPIELKAFVRTHLDHRLTALVAPVIDEVNAYRSSRGDVSKAAQEGSYVMLRLFIEFLGVKSQKNPTTSQWKLEERANLPKNNPGRDVQESDLVLSCFTRWGLRDLKPSDFGADESFIAKVHRTLCRINAHFTYDHNAPQFGNRIASLSLTDLAEAVKIIVLKLDEHFYQKVGEDIVIHHDLKSHFASRFGVKSNVKSN